MKSEIRQSVNLPYDVRIEKNVPLPQKRAKKGKWVAVLAAMEPGDSFLASINEASSFATLARAGGRSVATRRTGGNEDRPIRVWLVEKAS